MKRKKNVKTILLIILLITISNLKLLAQNYTWAFRFGNTSPDDGRAIVSDATGNIYVTGWVNLTIDFDPGPGSANGGSIQAGIYIAKYDAAGNYIWAKRIGGSGGADEKGNDITLDASGHVIITGEFEGTIDFDPGAGTANLTSAGDFDIFVAKYDTSGNYIWAVSMGSNVAFGDIGKSVNVDANDNIYVAGSFRGTADFDPGAGTANLTSGGLTDIFIAKYDPSGNYVWAHGIGNTNNDYCFASTMNNSNEFLITGYFKGSVDFDPGASVNTLTSTASNREIFIAKYDATGNYIWAKNMPGNYWASGHSIASDASGNIYLTGEYSDIVDFDPGISTVNLIPSAGADIFLAKYDASGNYLWANGFASSHTDVGYSVILDNYNNVYVSGEFSDTIDFDPSASIANLISNGDVDIFIAKYNSSGNYGWAISAGSTYPDGCLSLASGLAGDIYASGYFIDTVDFDPGIGVANLICNATVNGDVFIAKYSQIGVGINELLTNKAHIYPNPFTDEIKIINESSDTENNQVRIFDSFGRIVYEKVLTSIETTIQLKDLANDIYFLIIISKTGVRSTKLFKQ